MIVGTHTSETAKDKINTILRAAPDLEFSLRIKRERQRAGQYQPIGRLEQIVFEMDRDCQLDGPNARALGRRLYWPDGGPWLCRSIPEEDLIFSDHWRLPMPRVRDATQKTNPYMTDQHGRSHLPDGRDPILPRFVSQHLENIASAKHRNFLVFHPVAQIILLMGGKPPRSAGATHTPGMRSLGTHDFGGNMMFGALGSHRMPLSSLAGFDGRKMALLVDPQTGEALFSGGRYSVDLRG